MSASAWREGPLCYRVQEGKTGLLEGGVHIVVSDDMSACHDKRDQVRVRELLHGTTWPVVETRQTEEGRPPTATDRTGCHSDA